MQGEDTSWIIADKVCNCYDFHELRLEPLTGAITAQTGLSTEIG